MTISRLRKIFHKRQPAIVPESKLVIVAQDELTIRYDVLKPVRLKHYPQNDKEEKPAKRVAWTWLGV